MMKDDNIGRSQSIFAVLIKNLFEYGTWFKKRLSGKYSNAYYEYFFTKAFDLNGEFYTNKRILDIGCGPRGSLEWATMALERVGLDPLANLYGPLGAHEHAMKYITAPAENIPFEANYFDIVSSFNSLDHVNNIEKTIYEIKRIIRTGGYFLLITEVNHKARILEPQSLTWQIVKSFQPELRLFWKKELINTGKGIYQSVLDNKQSSVIDDPETAGILMAMFEKT